jgi:hypothetical protein
MNEDIFNSVFWLSISTMILTSFGVLLKYCLKSKCDKIDLCFGLIKVHRNVEIENDIEIRQPSTPENNNNNNNINNIV